MIQSDPDAVNQAEEAFTDGEVAEAFGILKDEVERLHEELDDLRENTARTATVHWNGPNPVDMEIEASDTGNSVKPFLALKDKADAETLQNLEQRVAALENGEADVVVHSEFDGDELPIERKIAERNANANLQANTLRATLVFPKFFARGNTRGGTLIALPSDKVKEILEETTDRTQWPNETIKRVMHRTAELTSHEDEPPQRDPGSRENLLWVEMNEKTQTLELCGELAEVREFYERLEEDAA